MRRTKIVCTIGPASNSPEILEQLIRAGMNVARLNFSHGTHEDHGKTLDKIRSIASRLGRPIAILQDLAGPKIRIGEIKDSPITLEPEATFTITNRDVPGDKNEVSVNYFKICRKQSPDPQPAGSARWKSCRPYRPQRRHSHIL